MITTIFRVFCAIASCTPLVAKIPSRLLALIALGMLVASGQAFAQTDYDTDNDNYIDVSGHAQLNAIRYDLNGDGVVASTDTANYNAAFPNATTGMGCASTCVGYELTANIDLDTSGNSMADTTDAYWNSGAGWVPIASADSDGNRYTGDFKGNRFTIDNLFISRSASPTAVGLFGFTSSTTRIESLGLTNANVTGNEYVGILVGGTRGEVVACYSTGSVTATIGVVGGLVGWTPNAITTSYSHASVSGTRHVGGLLGALQGGTVTNSYATGAVTRSSGTDTRVGGLIGAGTGAATASYWNTTTSGQSTSAGGSGAMGRTTTQLQSPTDYTGIYANWNIDLDNLDGDGNTTTGEDYPWYFGTSSQYPTLTYGTPGDYDIDNDNYIDVANLAQLNAIRYDLDGDGVVTGSDTTNYKAAFPDAATGMGCGATCVGYELLSALDFDSDGDGDVDASDHGGTYWDSGAGWTPIGTATPTGRYSGNFKGNGFRINNLFISRSGTSNQGLFGAISGRVETLGIINANVTAGGYSGILSGRNYGTIVACYTTGAMQSSGITITTTGGLVGEQNGTDISTSYSTASVIGDTEIGGLIGWIQNGSVTNSYSTGSVTGSSNAGGLIGGARSAATGNVTASYWDTSTSGQSTSAGGSGAMGKTTSELQSPTGYTGIYATWNADINAQSGNDDPWDFGTSSEYPALKYDGHNIFAQGRGDYDADNDGYIDVANLAQLSAIRHDLNTDGVATNAAYATAFPNRSTDSAFLMGCPSGACTGYELIASLDFDENGDGEITQAGDPTYWNGGGGWSPISSFAGKFKGNGHTINNLFINRLSSGNNDQGLFGIVNGSGARIETLGVTNANVSGYTNVGSVAGRILNGTVVACYSTGNVEGNFNSGGLVGQVNGGSASVSSSYSTAFVEGGTRGGGLVGRMLNNASMTNSYSTGAIDIFFSPGGLVGGVGVGGASVTNSYWDTVTSNRGTSAAGTGKTTAELQSPTTYGATSSDTYYNWDANLDGMPGNDDPWNFGAMDQYPVLKYASMDTTVQFNLQPGVATLTLMPLTIPENGGMSTVTATLTRSKSVATTITVSPVAGAYTVGTDATIIIAAGQTANASDTVVLTAVNNTRDEPNRSVDLSVVYRNALGTGRVIGATEITFTDDDAPPMLLINSPSAVEDNDLTFTVSLDATSGKEVTVAYADATTGNATSGTDYTALTAGTLTFAAGTTSATITVPVTDDSADESNETVVVTLSSAVNATFDGGATSLTGTGTIIDNDGSPALSIGSPSVIEGATGATLTFQVFLSPAHTSAVTVAYADAGTGSATSGTDYTALAAGTLTFAANATSATISVAVTDDSADESNETVVVRLSNASGATFDGGAMSLTGIGTIIDDDAVMLRIDSPQVAEGAAGATPTLRFTVSLSSAHTSAVTVAYADAGTGSAESGTDYTALAAGTLTFAVGDISKTIDISVIGDATIEQDETVVITLSNADNAALAVVTGTGTITNDDRPPPDPAEPEPDPDTEPTFTEAVDPQSYRQNRVIEPLTLPAATDGNGDLTYSLTELPEGLTFDAETRTVSGTPTKATEKAIYTLTATDEDGDEDAMGFFLTIVANVLPSFGDAKVTTQAYLRKQEIESMTLPQATGGDEPLTYALTPDLPEGLSFNAETHIVSGTPLEATAETTYTLTATDNDGDKATLMFTLVVTTDPIPTFGDTIVAAQVYMQHREIESMTLPQAFGGDEPLTYALSPDLPEGLTFDAETRIVSGTPIKAMDETTCTLTATDSNGDAAHLLFTLEVPDLVPAFGDSTTIAAQGYLVNQEIASLTFPQATGGDGLLVYILLPFLPEGLNFDPTTRTLSGLPSEAKAQATYTMSALDADGDTASLPFTLEVSLPSPDFNGDGNVNFADFLTFASKFNSRLGQERYDPRCDLNGDGEINLDDFRIFVDSFGT